MTKSKIIILIVSAVVVIAGAATAAVLVRNMPAKDDAVPAAKTSADITREDTQYLTPPVVPSTSALTEPTIGESTTARKVVTPAAPAGKKPSSGSNNSGGSSSSGNVNTDGLAGNKYVQKGKDQLTKISVLGYQYNKEGNYYYCNDKDCWQKDFGYNEMYDKFAPVAVMFIDCVRVRFTYGDYDWMIQLWKGQYGWLFVGAEIGVYTAEIGKNTGGSYDVNHYDCAAEKNWLNMEMYVYWQDDPKSEAYGGRTFSRPYTKYWWCTGFTSGLLNDFTSPINEVQMRARITFKSEQMATLFTNGLAGKGFRKAASRNALSSDSYYRDGADVYFLWRSIVDTTLQKGDVSEAAAQ